MRGVHLGVLVLYLEKHIVNDQVIIFERTHCYIKVDLPMAVEFEFNNCKFIFPISK